MNRRRALVLLSIDDEETMTKVEFLSRSPSLEGFELKFCYAIREEEYERTQSYGVPYVSLLQILETEVESFDPDLLTFHTGASFNARPDSFLQALAVIKDRHPAIEIRYEHVPFLPSYGMRERYQYAAIPMAHLLEGNKLFGGEDEEILTWRLGSRY